MAKGRPGTWYAVSLKPAGWSAIDGVRSKGTFPVGDYGSKCVCCDVETDSRMAFNPSTGNVASAIKLPRCADCATHVAAGNNMSIVMYVLGAAGILVGAYGLKWSENLYTAIGAACFATLGAILLAAKRRRIAMEARGHRSGLEIAVLPGLVSVRTTNPRFADEIRERNPELTTQSPRLR